MFRASLIGFVGDTGRAGRGLLRRDGTGVVGDSYTAADDIWFGVGVRGEREVPVLVGEENNEAKRGGVAGPIDEDDASDNRGWFTRCRGASGRFVRRTVIFG